MQNSIIKQHLEEFLFVWLLQMLRVDEKLLMNVLYGSQRTTTFKKSAELDLTFWTCLLIFEIFNT